MKIQIKIHPSLRTIVNFENGMIDIKEDITIEKLLQQWGLKQSTVVVTLNKRILPKETVIRENDIVEIYPILIGG